MFWSQWPTKAAILSSNSGRLDYSSVWAADTQLEAVKVAFTAYANNYRHKNTSVSFTHI